MTSQVFFDWLKAGKSTIYLISHYNKGASKSGGNILGSSEFISTRIGRPATIERTRK